MHLQTKHQNYADKIVQFAFERVEKNCKEMKKVW